MDVEFARLWLSRIGAMAGNAEAAHGEEDDFRAAVLAAIAEGTPDAQELAAIALETDDISFERWCA